MYVQSSFSDFKLLSNFKTFSIKIDILCLTLMFFFIYRTCCHSCCQFFPLPHAEYKFYEKQIWEEEKCWLRFFSWLGSNFFQHNLMFDNEWAKQNVMIDMHNDFHTVCLKCFHAILCYSFFRGSSCTWYYEWKEMSWRWFCAILGLELIWHFEKNLHYKITVIFQKKFSEISPLPRYVKSEQAITD